MKKICQAMKIGATNLFFKIKRGHLVVDLETQKTYPFVTVQILYRFFYLFKDKECMWFRFFNKWGMHFISDKSSLKLFSERMGLTKSINLFGYAITFLK